MPRILAFIDASVYADSVCDHAAWVARRMGAGVDLIHVLGRREMTAIESNLSGSLAANARDLLLAELSANDEQQAKLAQRRGRLILEHAKARLTEAGVTDVTTKLRIGDLVETMHEFEADADLIVIGKRGEAADFAKLHLGSNIERVVRASIRPVLVSSRAFEKINRVLIAYDGGPSINKALNYLASAHALFGGLDVHLLMVADEAPDARHGIDGAAAALGAAGYATETRIAPGQPEQVIAEAVATEKFDLLVMGAYGHSRIRNLIIGSTTTEMIRSCKIPVVLFR